MFAVHLMAFYFTKLKEDQIKKVSTLRAERYLVLSSLIELTDPYTWKDLRELIRIGTRHTGAVKKKTTHRRGQRGKSPTSCTLHTVLSLQFHSKIPGRHQTGKGWGESLWRAWRLLCLMWEMSRREGYKGESFCFLFFKSLRALEVIHMILHMLEKIKMLTPKGVWDSTCSNRNINYWYVLFARGVLLMMCIILPLCPRNFLRNWSQGGLIKSCQGWRPAAFSPGSLEWAQPATLATPVAGL